MMKKRISALLLCFCLAALCLPAASGAEAAPPFAGGSGTAEDPYRIDSPEGLFFLSERVNAGEEAYSAAHYLLTRDISLFDEAHLVPIGMTAERPFRGVFDGGCRSIIGMYAELPRDMPDQSAAYAGLFGVVEGGTVKNLTLSGGAGGYRAAGLVAWNRGGTVANCCVSVSVSGVYDRHYGSSVGGVVWRNEGGTVANCCFLEGVVGPGTHIVFDNTDGGRVVNCYNASTDNGGVALNSAGTESVAEFCYSFYDGSYAYPDHIFWAASETTITGCAFFSGPDSLLTPTDGTDPDTEPDAIYGGSATLLEALNAWVDAQPEGEYPRWVQTPGSYPLLEGMTDESKPAPGPTGSLSHFRLPVDRASLADDIQPDKSKLLKDPLG